MVPTKKSPFEVPYDEIAADPDWYIDAVFETLQSSFLILPRGTGFVPYRAFQQAYEVLKRRTTGFTIVNSVTVMSALLENALAFIVLRSMLGFTPSELAYAASQEASVRVSQGFARSLDRGIRTNHTDLQSRSPKSLRCVEAMVAAACGLLREGATNEPGNSVHRLNKADTRSGLQSVEHVAVEGVPYSMLLYERFLGRPFASHRDSVSELIGEAMEDAVEAQLRRSRVSFRKTKRAERIEGFDQAPDFIVPDEWNPIIVIEAKITEDDGTARDKVTRIQHLAEIGRQWGGEGQEGFSVIACVDGRGFGERREDMRKLLEATRGKVFTLRTMRGLVENSKLQEFQGDQ